MDRRASSVNGMSPSQQLTKGFILSAQSSDHEQTKSGPQAQIELWIKSADQTYQLKTPNQSLVLFTRQTDFIQVQHALRAYWPEIQYKQLKLTNFNHEAMAAIYCANHQLYYDVRSALRKVRIESFENDFPLHERYLMERFCYGSIEFTGTPIGCNHSYQIIDNAKIKPSQHTPKLSLLSLDIECSGKGELFSIGYYSQDPKKPFEKVCMIGPEQKPSEPWIEWVKDEYALLIDLIQTVQNYDPDIIIGWNVINFDFRLLIKRAQKHGLTLNLGRDQSAASWRDSRLDPQDGFININGRKVIDGIDALKAETYQFPSFSLENVSQELLGIGKDSDDVDNRLEAIEHDFIHNKPKLARYNLQDCKLVYDIFKKTKVLDFLIFRSQLTGLALDKRGGSVAAFTNLYLPKLHRAGFIAPNLPEGGGLASPGGYVMESKPGLYKNVLVLDFKSLYPSIIRTFKIDPLGLIKGLQEPDSIEGFKGARFSREHHFLPELIDQLWHQRDLAKQEQDKAKSNAIKILMNSFYGVLGSGGCRFYDTRLASSITMRGHEIMQQTARWIEALGYEVIYGDTDSTFVLLDEKLSQAECEKIGLALVLEINENWQTKLRSELGLECHLELEFETHFHRFLMPTIRGTETGSKKRYAGLTLKDGQEQTVFKGLETVRTDWTELAKQFQTQLFDDVFHDQDPSDYIKQTVFATIQGHYDHLLTYRKRLRRPLKEYTKSLPPHVKAAIHADLINERNGQPLKYQQRTWIEYVMTVNGPEAIEHQQSPIDYEHYVMKQLMPIADAILPFIELDFAGLFEQQISLF